MNKGIGLCIFIIMVLGIYISLKSMDYGVQDNFSILISFPRDKFVHMKVVGYMNEARRNSHCEIKVEKKVISQCAGEHLKWSPCMIACAEYESHD